MAAARRRVQTTKAELDAAKAEARDAAQRATVYAHAQAAMQGGTVETPGTLSVIPAAAGQAFTRPTLGSITEGPAPVQSPAAVPRARWAAVRTHVHEEAAQRRATGAFNSARSIVAGAQRLFGRLMRRKSRSARVLPTS